MVWSKLFPHTASEWVIDNGTLYIIIIMEDSSNFQNDEWLDVCSKYR